MTGRRRPLGCRLECFGSLVPLLWTGVPTTSTPVDRQDPLPILRCPGNAFMLRRVFPDHLIKPMRHQISAISPPHDHCMCTRQFSHRSRCSSCAAALSALYLAPPRHRIPDLFSFLHRIMSRVILLIVCALSVASCLVVQTGAMRSAGERPPQSRGSFSPRARP